MITIKIRPFFISLVLLIIFFPKAYPSDMEFFTQEPNKGHLQGFPKELIKLITNRMPFLSIVKASTASKTCFPIFDSEIGWENMVQAIPGYERYKDLNMPAKQVFIALMKPGVHISKSGERKELPAHYLPSLRLWSTIYREEIVDEVITKDELSHQGPFTISVTTF